MADERAIRNLVRSEIERTVAEEFQLLRRVPSTYVWKAIEYVRALHQAERDEPFEAFMDRSLYMLLAEADPTRHPGQTGHRAYRRFCDGMVRTFDWRYVDVRTLRMYLADRRSPRPGPGLHLPDDVARQAAAIVPISAGELRKRLKAALGERFGARPENRGGGDWIYTGRHSERAFSLHIDFGGRSDQLRYEVSYVDSSTGIHANRLNYEGMLGFGLGNWDYVTASTADDAVSHLCDLVARLVSIPDRLQTGHGA